MKNVGGILDPVVSKKKGAKRRRVNSDVSPPEYTTQELLDRKRY